MKYNSNISIFVLPFIMILFSNTLSAQKSDISFTYLTMDDGLSQSSINCMLQDKEGFIWFGTQGGLNKYNGSSSQPFKVYLHNISDTNSLSSSWVYGISEDNSGNIWVATMSGLDKLDRKTGNIIRHLHDPEDPQTISGDRIFGVLVDSRGYIWAKTIDAINKLDTATGKFTRFVHDIDYFTKPSLNYSFPIFEDSQDNLWIGTQDGLFMFDRDYETWKRFSVKDCYISDNHINVIYEDPKGNLWIGTNNGLNKFNYKTGKFINYFHNDMGTDNSLSSNDIRAIREDCLGRLWIGTFGGGLNMFDPKTDEFRIFMPKVNDPNSISHPLILSIIEDNSHILWVGTYGGAINKIDLKSKKFNLFTQHNFGLNYNDMAAIYEEDSILWIGTWGGGLNLYNKKTEKIELITSKSKGKRKLTNNFVHVILKDSRGYIWIGTRNGINIYNKKTDEFTTLKSLFKDNNILSGDEVFDNIRINDIIEDKYNNIWVGTEDRLYNINFETKSVKAYAHETGNEESLSNNHVYAVLEDKEGFIWIGTVANGMNRYNPVTGVFMRYQGDVRNPNTISNNRVFDVFEDSDGLLWIATGSGLNKFNKKDTSFTIYTKNDGLPSDLIYNIIEDNNKNLWMSTGYGFAMFDRKTNTFKSYDKADGLGSLELNFGSIYKSKSGEIYFGGPKGLNSFYPDSLFENPYIPKMVFLEYTKNNNDGIFTKPLDNVEEIELFHNDHTITIYFAALEFTNPQKNRYKYKMEGLSDDWTDLENQNFQTFSNLPAGDYVLTVIGSNNDMIWNEEGVSLKITVHPPYWQTTWAYLAYLVLLVLFVYNIIRLRTKKLKSANQTLRSKQMAALEIARQKEELTVKNKSITDSINYAKRIQEAMMPSEFLFKKLLPQSFVFYKPKDIVSGDFYWIVEKNNKIFVAVVDCTGHGVPGAFMSIIGFDLLRNITKEQGVEDPAQILNQLNIGVSETFSKNVNEQEVKDGMDVSLCIIDKNQRQIEYAGAMNPLYIVRNNKIIQIKGNRFAIGTVYLGTDEQKFENHIFSYKDDDMIYLFSDGYTDQFGGPIGKKFKFRRYRHLLLTINKLSMGKQKKFLDENIENWKGELEQVDDILVIGIRL